MDVEFSCLGDPLADLGALRMRDTSLDKSVINFHAVRFALLTAMLSAGARADPPAEFDMAQWEAWSVMSLLIYLEVITEEEGIDTVPVADLSLRTHREGPLHESALRILDDVLSTLEPEVSAESADRADEEKVLGVRCDDWQSAAAELEQQIAACDLDDSTVLPLLWRRLRRRVAIIDPAMRDVRGFEVQRIDWSTLPLSRDGR
jgi:hypothetical protein